MRRTLRVLAATVLAAGVVTVGSSVLSSASAGVNDCDYTFGQNSFSARCATNGPAYEFRAWVQCINGRRDGGWVTTNSGQWSIASCGPWWIDRLSYGVDVRPLS
ncbi:MULTISPECIES: hypothetical protein [Streptosporangium]|uniref:Uncharacterized protein n=1 Tax=Streptosporangium brasiliense TaxID=47480 RepID=A0ABT9RK12_9ACTN|nr:hypothetical protein [Streptosporangium brasiliense]MDP9869074.1 hypothetical protein [Streptosporangium brasiliense]